MENSKLHRVDDEELRRVEGGVVRGVPTEKTPMAEQDMYVFPSAYGIAIGYANQNGMDNFPDEKASNPDLNWPFLMPPDGVPKN